MYRKFIGNVIIFKNKKKGKTFHNKFYIFFSFLCSSKYIIYVYICIKERKYSYTATWIYTQRWTKTKINFSEGNQSKVKSNLKYFKVHRFHDKRFVLTYRHELTGVYLCGIFYEDQAKNNNFGNFVCVKNILLKF